jgi:hypothetical protein
MNFWRQTNHIMAFFKEENFRGEKRLPSNFITGFLEVGPYAVHARDLRLMQSCRVVTRMRFSAELF